LDVEKLCFEFVEHPEVQLRVLHLLKQLQPPLLKPPFGQHLG
jgi:hypothetical protein